MNQIDEFFQGLPEQDKKVADILESPVTPENGGNEQRQFPPENGEEPRKNRHHRRLEQQLAQEREARIRAEAIAETASEMSRFTADSQGGDVDSRWLRIYGDSPETREAWRLQQDILNDYKIQAKEEALMEIHQEQVEYKKKQDEYESFIDSQFENIEDEYGVDLTSNAPAAKKARREFIEMVQQASPKDEEGNLTGYADFDAVWDFYQTKLNKEKGSTTRQREISSRTMSRTNGSTTTESQITPGFDGWRKDYGV
jgi:hypothetical protein